MNYETNRDLEQLRMLDHLIDDFVDRYFLIGGPANGQRHTVFLFPGGLGSQLKRATKPYVQGGPSNQTFAYERKWLDIWSMMGTVLEVEMVKVGGKHRDKGNRFVLADGPVKIAGRTPYDGFTAWCEAKKIDYFVFGWDWRRTTNDIGKFFVKKFLPYFQERVKDECNNADVLQDYSLVGHSAGGMIVNWILRKHDTPALRAAVTVATPFYGYGGQIHRFFEGEPLLALLDQKKVRKVLTSMPALYAFQFLDAKKTFAKYGAALAADPNFPLAAYPSTDMNTGDVADPYYPLTNGALHRYPTPSQTGFDLAEVKKARKLVQLLASDLDPLIAGKFFNIRCVSGPQNTLGSTTWQWVPPIAPSPIGNVAQVPGDDTQPAWTARHIGLAASNPANVMTLAGFNLGHLLTMSQPQTIAAVATALNL
ncbi:hypothetical protein QTI17_10140 [Variovorax sp. J31P179]|jgi:pimeloyl-ACP methyl ester carboxylesterase|uniref:hypothetical protein n=1 Tax=Variovorax sp. J31P179 TaxID=3053508 RepID=UPI00257727A8|nr:hypothetical protein [Variovorax sp. J31P179]MDM0080950.1 hypothetical protein [Variovorax sp. J31P179]